MHTTPTSRPWQFIQEDGVYELQAADGEPVISVGRSHAERKHTVGGSSLLGTGIAKGKG